MALRPVAFVVPPAEAPEAPGVTIRRTVGGERLIMLDPFFLFDHASVDPGGDVVGFHRHPHRGIQTLSYVIRGRVRHRDSIGNEGEVGANGSQWMTAGNGIYHEEMLIPGPEGAEFLQLWFNLPQAQKRIAPAYGGLEGEGFPVVPISGGTVRVVAGVFHGHRGPFDKIVVDPTILDVVLDAGAVLEIETDSQATVALYVVSGSVYGIGNPNLVVFAQGDAVRVQAGPEGARFLFAAAHPLHEPVLQFRSFVMNTPDDIRETLDMIDSGTFAQG